MSIDSVERDFSSEERQQLLDLAERASLRLAELAGEPELSLGHLTRMRSTEDHSLTHAVMAMSLIELDYPNEEEEIEIARTTTGDGQRYRRYKRVRTDQRSGNNTTPSIRRR